MRFLAITLCYNKPEILRASVARFHETKHGGLPMTHILVDQHYPLPSDTFNTIQLKAICADHGCIYLDPGKNLGLHEGLNWALRQVGMQDEDIVIGYDGDSYPIDNGWDMALLTALTGDARAVWASLWGKNSEGELSARGYTERMTHQVRVRETHTPAVNSICAWKGWWIKKAGWFREPSQWYGGLECAMWPWVRPVGHAWVYLPDWREDERLKFEPGEDRLYKEWKWDHAHNGNPMSFDQWLKNKGLI